MKVEQLRESVAALGFESGIYDERLFILSSNRALELIFTEREVTREAVICADFPTPTEIFKSYIHKGGERDTFRISGVAYSFRATGSGAYTVRDKSGSFTHKLSGDGALYRGFISGDAEIVFTGEFRYSVYSLASFDSIVSKDASDIPTSAPEYPIDLEKKIPDYLAPASLPYDYFGHAVKGARIVGKTLYLPSGTSGEVRMLYRRSARPIGSDLREDIDIPRECECLLPLLTASFMWLEDDSDMAQYYMALYKNALATVEGEVTGRLDTDYATNGWA